MILVGTTRYPMVAHNPLPSSMVITIALTETALGIHSTAAGATASVPLGHFGGSGYEVDK
jgi:hypothetical protein